MDRVLLEKQLAELPLVQYMFISTRDIPFSEKVRRICEQECPMYDRSWACPPAVGSAEDCRKRCLFYSEALLIVTAAEVRNAADMAETLATVPAHEEVTRQAWALVRRQTKQSMALSAQACTICDSCAWGKGKCRYPEKMLPCVESHGIVVSDLADRAGVDFYAGSGLVHWFSLILYR